MMKYVCMMKNRHGGIDRIETFWCEDDEQAYARVMLACVEAEASPDGGAELWSEGRLVRSLTIM